MLLSVIVTSYNSPATLLRCLDSLVAQRDAGKIVVVDCSTEDPSGEIRTRFPGIHVLHFNERRSVPRMRWAALDHAPGSVIAAVEARCIPEPDWSSKLLAAHKQNPNVPAIGGPVHFEPGQSALDDGLYFCEYGNFAPPITEGPVNAISGANLSYKRNALTESKDLLDAGHWETHLHLRLIGQGRILWLCSAGVRFENSMTAATILRQRWSYGRAYASARFPETDWPRRLLYAAATPLLPFVLTARGATAVARKALLARFLRALGWVLIFNTAWSCGEVAGYLFGASLTEAVY